MPDNIRTDIQNIAEAKDHLTTLLANLVTTRKSLHRVEADLKKHELALKREIERLRKKGR
jgi:hypothetical protein